MFNRKLEERVARLERLVKGEEAQAGGHDPFFGFYFQPVPAKAGLLDKIEALATKLGVEFKKQPDVLGTWEAVKKQPAKRSKKG